MSFKALIGAAAPIFFLRDGGGRHGIAGGDCLFKTQDSAKFLKKLYRV